MEMAELVKEDEVIELGLGYERMKSLSWVWVARG